MSDFELSVVIKAFNEEEKIARCIESILAEIDLNNTEVVLVDSKSTDNTVAIAQKYPIKIIQFAQSEIPSAPKAAELGYQYSSGKFFLLIDGDMELLPGFIGLALDKIKSDESIAGVGGIIRDTQSLTEADRKRERMYSRVKEVSLVSSLGGGGLYRRSAIAIVNYFSHLGLQACEELELGVRLSAARFKLVRLNVPAFSHTGHQESNLLMCRRLWSNGRLSSYALLIKSSIGKPWFFLVVRECWFLFVVITTLAVSLIVSTVDSFNVNFLSFLALSWLMLFALLSIKNKSFVASAWSVCLWWLLFFAIFRVVFSKIEKPGKLIEFTLK